MPFTLPINLTSRCPEPELYPCVEDILDVSDYPPTVFELYNATEADPSTYTCRKGPGDACVQVRRAILSNGKLYGVFSVVHLHYED